MNFFAQAIGAGALQNGKFTDVPSASPAVIGTRTGQKLGPAIFAQVLISFTDVFAATDTDRRPKKLI
jgi:hypothetical protein